MKLLSDDTSNLKLSKSAKTKYKIYGLSLAPHKMNGKINLCPDSSEGCRKSCLYSSGFGYTFQTQKARLKRTQYLINDTQYFINQLATEVLSSIVHAKKLGRTPVFRLNMTSDIAWEYEEDLGLNLKPSYKDFESFKSIPDLITSYDGIIYDYTKRIDRIYANKCPEYHLTFSRTEDNIEDCIIAEDHGHNIAKVFRYPEGFYLPPEYYKDYPVVNGDENDLRFLDPKNSIVALRDKGNAKDDKTGFVIQLKESDYTDEEIKLNKELQSKKKYNRYDYDKIDIAKTKVCPKCNIEKDLETGFYKNPKTKDKCTYYCKDCQNEYSKKLNQRRKGVN